MGINNFTKMDDPELDPLRKSGKPQEKAARKATHGAAKEAGQNIQEGKNLLKDLNKTKQGFNKLAGATNATGPVGKLKKGYSDARGRLKSLNRATDVNQLAKDGGKKVLSAAADKGIDALAKYGAGVTGGLSLVAAPIIKKYKKETLEIILAILIVIFLPTLFLIYLFFGNAAGELAKKQQQAGQTNPLQITVTCIPPDPAAGQTSVCTISVIDSESESDITVTANIYPGGQYISSNPGGVYDKNTDTVTWDANKLNMPLNAPINLAFNITVKMAKKVGVPIVAIASPGGITAGGCGNVNKTATDFDTLLAGQGRCITVLGNEDQFVTAVLKNAGTKLGLSGKSAQLHAIYQKASASNVNPLIVTTIWGVEAGWDTNGTEFGCKPFGSGFNAQLTCSVNTLNQWMTYFEQQKTKPVKLTTKCIYSDPFIFAYEKYTPVCVINDSNSNARTNFTNYYRQLLGL